MMMDYILRSYGDTAEHWWNKYKIAELVERFYLDITNIWRSLVHDETYQNVYHIASFNSKLLPFLQNDLAVILVEVLSQARLNMWLQQDNLRWG
jgi:hypothetical protein